MAKELKSQIDSIKKAMFKPYMCITDKDLKDIKDYKIGKEYEMTVKGKLVELDMPAHDSYGIEDDMFDKDEVKARFEITSVK